jgi:hypothetical protein
LEKKPATGKALPILAHKVARAVYDLLKRKTAVAMNICLHTYGRRAGEPGASLDTQGMSLHGACSQVYLPASLNATVRLGPVSLRLPR